MLTFLVRKEFRLLNQMLCLLVKSKHRIGRRKQRIKRSWQPIFRFSGSVCSDRMIILFRNMQLPKNLIFLQIFRAVSYSPSKLSIFIFFPIVLPVDAFTGAVVHADSECFLMRMRNLSFVSIQREEHETFRSILSSFAWFPRVVRLGSTVDLCHPRCRVVPK